MAGEWVSGEAQMKTLTVIEPGQQVTIAGDIAAVVTAVCVRGISVSYEVGWFNGRAYEEKWLADFMVKPNDEGSKISIGFRV